ncbi:hypothetical protein DV736_g1783, partial [Chaetothyriales sp. CBS 134916]
MLATQRMSSHGGQLPFGCKAAPIRASTSLCRACTDRVCVPSDNPTAFHGIGLPEFLSPGEPMGQSILNDEESSTLNHFFSDFELNQPPQAMPLQFPPPQNSQQPLFTMPPLYFGSETSDGIGPGIDPHTLQLDGQPNAYPNQPTYDLQILHVPGGSFSQALVSSSGLDDNANANASNTHTSNTHTSNTHTSNTHTSNTHTSNTHTSNTHPNNASGQFDPPLLDQLHEAAASVQHPQPGFTSNWNQQPYQPHGMPLQAPGRGPMMRFGSDLHFTQSGFQLPSSSAVVDSEDATLSHWLPSAPNSRPPTQPNTQPSSPDWSKKRKLDDFNVGSRRNGYHATLDNGSNGHNGGHRDQRNQSLSQVKYEPHAGSLPLSRVTASNAQSHHSDDHHSDDVDAAAESDDDPFNTSLASANAAHSSSAPGLWPSSKGRPSQANRPRSIGKPPRKRKKSPASTTPTVTTIPFPSSNNNALSSNRPKSSPSKTTRAPSTRVPLTTEQKKANHTNSEQRRRDATARAYAELYDLVPEVADMGKQSTMKKLELVVDKVSWTISAVESLRAKLGIKKGSRMDLIKGHSTSAASSYPNHGDSDDSFANHAAHAGVDGVVEDARIDGEACYPDLD